MSQRARNGSKNGKITFQPNIGLDEGARQSVVDILNLLLADESVLSLKTHRADEHTGVETLPELNSLYETQYKQINAISDEIVERVLILGSLYLYDPEKLIKAARLDGLLTGVPDVISILADHEAFIRFLREDAQKCSELYEDQGTFLLLINILRTHEKIAWMLRSYINN